MSGRGWILLIAALAPTLWAREGASAQQAPMPIAAIPVQSLDFGLMMPGTSPRVTVGDVSRRAEILLRGQGGAQVKLLLPTEMLSREGARIPLRFSDLDAALLSGAGARAIPFNPHLGTRVEMPAAGEALLILGATATVPLDQPAGQYTASVVVLVVDTKH